MVKSEIIDLKDMTDSRELFESKPHKFLAIFTYILIAIISAVFIWSYYGKIDIYVKGQGLVRPTDKISIIKNSLNGKIEIVNIEDGKQVNTGDILYTIEIKNLETTIQNYKIKLSETETEISSLNKYRKSIEKNENLFKISEEKYHTLVEKYLTDIDYANKQIDENITNVFGQKEGSLLILESIDLSDKHKNEELLNLQKYKESININQNLFTEEQRDYYTKYLDYELKYSVLTTAINDAQDKYEKNLILFNAGIISESDLNNIKSALELVQKEIEQLISNETLLIDQNVEQIRKYLEENEITKKKAEQTITTYTDKRESSELLIKKNKLQLLTSIDEQIKVYYDSEQEFKNDIKELEIQKSDSIIYAPISGQINLLQVITTGEYIQSGQEIATIIPESKDMLKIELAILNKDIANIKVGQKINFKILALPYKEYGKVKGIISKIGIDAKTDNFSNEKYFLVEAYVNNIPVENYKGKPEDIKVGMIVEGQVITDNKRILIWLLEKINFID